MRVLRLFLCRDLFLVSVTEWRLTYVDCDATCADFFKDYPAPPATGAEGEAPPQAFVMRDAPGDALESEPSDAANGDVGPPPEEPEEFEEPVVAECAAVTQWRSDFAAGLEAKVANERKVKAERAERAKQTLATMHARWERGAADAVEANRVKEREFLMQRDGVISQMSKPGEPPSWGVVPELVDMTGKFKEGARDTSRMRQVLMRMKTY